jgi:Flavodoxin reductases (ferredoxin-NADPH reductases) family 1
MLITATNHSLHHTQYNGNYGLYFRFWDIVCGTELKDTRQLFSEIQERKEVKIVDNTKYKTLKIEKLERETADTISVFFKPDDKLFYEYKAGQHLTMKFNLNGKVCHRCFSLSSTPGKDDFLRITAKRNGEVTNYLLNDAKVGDTIEALYPVGDFSIDSKRKKHLMIAGGSGITPLFSMINYLLEYQREHQIELLYANKSEDSIIFRKKLDALAENYPQFSYTNFISGQNRISVDDLKSNTNTAIYVCGPNSLKEAVVKYVKVLSVSNSQLNKEHYADGYVPNFGLV